MSMNSLFITTEQGENLDIEVIEQTLSRLEGFRKRAESAADNILEGTIVRGDTKVEVEVPSKKRAIVLTSFEDLAEVLVYEIAKSLNKVVRVFDMNYVMDVRVEPRALASPDDVAEILVDGRYDYDSN